MKTATVIGEAQWIGFRTGVRFPSGPLKKPLKPCKYKVLAVFIFDLKKTKKVFRMFIVLLEFGQTMDIFPGYDNIILNEKTFKNL